MYHVFVSPPWGHSILETDAIRRDRRAAAHIGAPSTFCATSFGRLLHRCSEVERSKQLEDTMFFFRHMRPSIHGPRKTRWFPCHKLIVTWELGGTTWIFERNCLWKWGAPSFYNGFWGGISYLAATSGRSLHEPFLCIHASCRHSASLPLKLGCRPWLHGLQPSHYHSYDRCMSK